MSGGQTFTRTLPEDLKDFAATERQKEFIDAFNKYGSNVEAGKALGVGADVVGRAIRKMMVRAAHAGKAPGHFNDGVAPGFKMGMVTVHRKNGVIEQTWERQKPDDQAREEAVRQFIEGLADRIEGKSPVVAFPAYADDDLLAIYPMGDPHFGMIAYADEAGEDFDLDRAAEDLNAAFDRLIASAPNAKTAIIAELGDFFHSDNEQNRTQRSGNSLDADRWSKVMQVGLDAMISCIEKVAAKHEKVIVRIVKGNHDSHSSFALSLALKSYFRNQPRIEIVISNSAFWYYEFGKNLLGLTHGDTAKPADLPGIMSVDQREAWGRTLYRYFFHGHIHNKRLIEFYGVLVESFRTLAGKDAWHAAEGYRSGQDMHLIVLHREYGEIMRTRADIRLVRKAA